jgi:hypothetical protein
MIGPRAAGLGVPAQRKITGRYHASSLPPHARLSGPCQHAAGTRVGSSAAGEQLVDQRHLTVALRFVVDDSQHLVHGEVVDADGTGRGTFRDWSALIKLLEQCLERV